MCACSGSRTQLKPGLSEKQLNGTKMARLKMKLTNVWHLCFLINLIEKIQNSLKKP
jgi:hypothetical protein